MTSACRISQRKLEGFFLLKITKFFSLENNLTYKKVTKTVQSIPIHPSSKFSHLSISHKHITVMEIITINLMLLGHPQAVVTFPHVSTAHPFSALGSLAESHVTLSCLLNCKISGTVTDLKNSTPVPCGHFEEASRARFLLPGNHP